MTTAVIFQSGPRAGELVPLEKERTVCGRGADCDIVLPSLAVSRRHFHILRRGERHYLEDLESSCGTYLNGQRCIGLTPLRALDEFGHPQLLLAFVPAEAPGTEARWLLDDSGWMFAYLKAVFPTRRRPRLFTAACLRQLGAALGVTVARARALETMAEASGQVTLFEGRQADAWGEAAEVARAAIGDASDRRIWSQQSEFGGRLSDEEVWQRADTAEAKICGLLREVFGNPFRAVACGPGVRAWGDGAVHRLALSAYEERRTDGTLDPVHLSILADAAEDAGADAALTAHLREPGPHVLGCWAVDALLGKS